MDILPPSRTDLLSCYYAFLLASYPGAPTQVSLSWDILCSTTTLRSLAIAPCAALSRSQKPFSSSQISNSPVNWPWLFVHLYQANCLFLVPKERGRDSVTTGGILQTPCSGLCITGSSLSFPRSCSSDDLTCSLSPQIIPHVRSLLRSLLSLLPALPCPSLHFLQHLTESYGFDTSLSSAEL